MQTKQWDKDGQRSIEMDRHGQTWRYRDGQRWIEIDRDGYIEMDRDRDRDRDRDEHL